jgi:hypothetical protein
MRDLSSCDSSQSILDLPQLLIYFFRAFRYKCSLSTSDLLQHFYQWFRITWNQLSGSNTYRTVVQIGNFTVGAYAWLQTNTFE